MGQKSGGSEEENVSGRVSVSGRVRRVCGNVSGGASVRTGAGGGL